MLHKPHLSSIASDKPVSPLLLGAGGVFLLGLLLGCLAAAGVAERYGELLAGWTAKFLTARSTQTSNFTFYSAFFPNFFAWILLLLLGYCAISLPLLAWIPLGKGIFYGVLSSSILRYQSPHPIRYLLWHLVPNAFFSSVVLLLCTVEAYRMSLFFWGKLSENNRGSGEAGGAFLARMILYLLCLIAAALLEAGSY